MQFSIIVPSWNNLDYLKICVESIIKNSLYKHDINVHLNEGTDGSAQYLKDKGIKFNLSKENIGLCSGANSAYTLAETEFIIYTNDDMYFLPKWDYFLEEEVKKTTDNFYFFSGTSIGPLGSGLQNKETKKLSLSELKNFDFDCGKTAGTFDESKVLNNYKNVKYFDHQGSHWAPHLIHKSMWDKIGGFSIEFDPGYASDTDISMKLWKNGVRIFKGINNCRVYHFGSITTRKKVGLTKNKGNRLFLQKWGISSDLFLKFYLRSNTQYDGPLTGKPIINIQYFVELIKCKIKFYLLKIFNL